MPIYEYVCENCHYIFEVFRSRFADDEIRCPRCGVVKPERLTSRSGRVGAGDTTSSFRMSSVSGDANSVRPVGPKSSAP